MRLRNRAHLNDLSHGMLSGLLTQESSGLQCRVPWLAEAFCLITVSWPLNRFSTWIPTMKSHHALHVIHQGLVFLISLEMLRPCLQRSSSSSLPKWTWLSLMGNQPERDVLQQFFHTQSHGVVSGAIEKCDQLGFYYFKAGVASLLQISQVTLILVSVFIVC